ncbi:hypothetical protein Xaut_3624 [Xanthobacter versatilis]|uniref:Uncharacterized protein n=1 Tax=Xanthobacter autotrophicus (strain ATCC BAA-1158 / Py2) TaxID=78245 RepID=A7ILF9_XANP2|nr:hypothetical protein Xaut_3624 [Xanthobacter autotrophicus Py2]
MADVPYHQMTAAQKLRAYWHPRCDADPVPCEFDEDMEAAGLITIREVTKYDLDDDCFAAERGIELGGWLWELTESGRATLVEAKKQEG